MDLVYGLSGLHGRKVLVGTGRVSSPHAQGEPGNEATQRVCKQHGLHGRKILVGTGRVINGLSMACLGSTVERYWLALGGSFLA